MIYADKHEPSVFVEQYDARVFFKDTQNSGTARVGGSVCLHGPRELKQHERNAGSAQLFQMPLIHSGSRDVQLADACAFAQQIPNRHRIQTRGSVSGCWSCGVAGRAGSVLNCRSSNILVVRKGDFLQPWAMISDSFHGIIAQLSFMAQVLSIMPRDVQNLGAESRLDNRSMLRGAIATMYTVTHTAHAGTTDPQGAHARQDRVQHGVAMHPTT